MEASKKNLRKIQEAHARSQGESVTKIDKAVESHLKLKSTSKATVAHDELEEYKFQSEVNPLRSYIDSRQKQRMPLRTPYSERGYWTMKATTLIWLIPMAIGVSIYIIDYNLFLGHQDTIWMWLLGSLAPIGLTFFLCDLVLGTIVGQHLFPGFIDSMKDFQPVESDTVTGDTYQPKEGVREMHGWMK